MNRYHFRKWALLLVTLVSTLVMGVRTSMGFFHFLFWFLVALIVTSLAWVFVEYFGTRLTLTRQAPGKLREDDALEIDLRVENSGILPAFNLVVEDELTFAAEAERKKRLFIDYLAARAVVRLAYTCRCPLRGKYKIGPLAVYYFDPLGLFFLKRSFSAEAELYVYPSTFPIKKLPELVRGTLPWFGIQSTRASGDEDEFFGIREYKEGDPVSRIHWFSTARKNSLIVKQFQQQNFFRATLLFNLEKDKNFGEGKDRIAEVIIKIVSSVAGSLLARDVDLEIIASTGQTVHFPFNRGPEHYEDIQRFLSVAQAESTKTLAEVFEERARFIPSNSTLIVIMLDKDWPALSHILELTQRDVSVIPVLLVSSTFLFCFDNQEVTRDINIKLLQAGKFKPVLISCKDNLEEAFNRI